MNPRLTPRPSRAAALSFVFLATAALPLAGRATSGFGEDPFPYATCPNEGVERADESVAFVSEDGCLPDDSFDLEIGTDANGNPITFGTTGCPEYILIKPEHMAPASNPVPNHYRVQDTDGYLLEQQFDCGGAPFVNLCFPVGGPDPTDFTFQRFREVGCPSVSGGTL